MGGCESRPEIKGFEDILNLLWDKTTPPTVYDEKENDISPEIFEVSNKFWVFGLKRKNQTYHIIGRIDSIDESTHTYSLLPLYNKKKKGEEGPGYVDRTDKTLFKIMLKDGSFVKEKGQSLE